MKKTLLKKLAKGASVALLAGVMVCGASLSTNANAAKTSKSARYEENGIKKGKFNSHKLGAAKPAKATKNTKKAAKGVKKSVKKSSKKVSKKSAKKAAPKKNLKKHAKRAKKTVRRSHAKKAVKKVNKRNRKSVRRNRRARRANRRVVRHAVKPMNRRAYRHEQVRRGTKNFRKTAYYHKVWTHAEKVNKNGMNFDLRQAKKDQKKGYKRAAKNALYHAHQLNWWVHHDQKMLAK